MSAVWRAGKQPAQAAALPDRDPSAGADEAIAANRA